MLLIHVRTGSEKQPSGGFSVTRQPTGREEESEAGMDRPRKGGGGEGELETRRRCGTGASRDSAYYAAEGPTLCLE